MVEQEELFRGYRAQVSTVGFRRFDRCNDQAKEIFFAVTFLTPRNVTPVQRERGAPQKKKEAWLRFALLSSGSSDDPVVRGHNACLRARRHVPGPRSSHVHVSRDGALRPPKTPLSLLIDFSFARSPCSFRRAECRRSPVLSSCAGRRRTAGVTRRGGLRARVVLRVIPPTTSRRRRRERRPPVLRRRATSRTTSPAMTRTLRRRSTRWTARRR